MYTLGMHASCYKESLRKIMADLRLLDSGWTPGTAELNSARSVAHSTILPPKIGEPIKLIALCSGPPEHHQLIVTSIFGLGEGWALTLDEWLVIVDPPHNSSVLDLTEIRLRGGTWLRKEMQRVEQLTVRHIKSVDGSMVGREIGKQLVELRSTRH